LLREIAPEVPQNKAATGKIRLFCLSEERF